jgi:hypothetical protein
MELKSFFPADMLKQEAELNMEGIAEKLTYFHTQLHLIHWQTMNYAEHMAVGSLYDYVHDFLDGVIEKLMGYTGRRIKSFKLSPITDNCSASSVTSELISFAHELRVWAENNKYDDVANLADSLSGECSKTRYLLTLS